MEEVSMLFSSDEEETSFASSATTAGGSLLGVKQSLVADNELLIRQAFESDPKFGCELLYRHYYQALCSHAARFVYSKTIAEDIVSDIFFQFYIKGTFKEITSSYRAFLYKSVRNKAYNYLRLEQKRTVELDQSHDETSDSNCQQPDSVIQYEELCQQVESAINALPVKCRRIYLMHRFEDKKYAEIADELQLSTRTVEVQIRKASLFVREVLSKKWLLLLLLFKSLC